MAGLTQRNGMWYATWKNQNGITEKKSTKVPANNHPLPRCEATDGNLCRPGKLELNLVAYGGVEVGVV